MNNRTSQATGCQESSLGSHHSRLNPRPPWSGYQPTSLPDLNPSSCSCLLTCFSTLNSLLVVDFQHLLPQTLPQTTLLHSQASVKSSPLHGALHFLSKGDPDRHLLSVLITQPAVCFSIFSTGLEISETVTVIIVCARLDPPSFCREFQYGRHYFFFFFLTLPQNQVLGLAEGMGPLPVQLAGGSSSSLQCSTTQLSARGHHIHSTCTCLETSLLAFPHPHPYTLCECCFHCLEDVALVSLELVKYYDFPLLICVKMIKD